MPGPCIRREYSEWLAAPVQQLVRRQHHRILKGTDLDTCAVGGLSKLALDLDVVRTVVLVKVNALRIGLLSEFD